MKWKVTITESYVPMPPWIAAYQRYLLFGAKQSNTQQPGELIWVEKNAGVSTETLDGSGQVIESRDAQDPDFII